MAWRFVANLTELESIDYLCYELPPQDDEGAALALSRTDRHHLAEAGEVDERMPLLDGAPEAEPGWIESQDDVDESANGGLESFGSTFANLNALEIAAIAGAKVFLRERPVQRVINGIWKGDIVFWDALSTHSEKKARPYNKARSDYFCRLRVPLYIKAFEIIFFAVFLVLYYVVLVEKSPVDMVTASEVMLYIWLAAFSYNELGELWDAGLTLYIADFWTSWDLAIILIGLAFFISRMLGIVSQDVKATNVAFDILSIEALFLVPRTFSLLSLHPYFGMLLPALKQMTKDFVKFLSLVAILYIGFDTTFTFLARGTYTFRDMNWILVKVFFGSGYLGFDIADQISPILGPPLMLVFVCLTNILLITSLISLLSLSLENVMEHSRDEYLLVYSVYVIEASTSNTLTYFYLPFNLIPLILRPLRLFLSADTLSHLRVVMLKATHWPFVACILGYEAWRARFGSSRQANPSSTAFQKTRRATNLRRQKSHGWRYERAIDSPKDNERSSNPVQENGSTVENSARMPLEKLVENLKAQVEEISQELARAKERDSIVGQS